MAGATFSRIKNWTTEILTNTDLNLEIDNILNNLGPGGVDDYSTSVAEMRLTTDPGESGTESLATSLAGEIERLRFAIKEIKGSGATYWYSSAGTSLTDILNAVGSSLSNNRISSGKVSANSNQLIALDPDGAVRTVVLDGTPTPFVYYINSVQYTINTDVSVTALTAAPGSNNTCLVNDSLAAANQYTQFLGEYGTTINVDTAGSEIASLVGKYAAFSLNNGSATEYFTAYVDSTLALTKAWRGSFFNSSQSTVPRLTFSDNNTISLLKLAWLFGTTASSVVPTYTVPVYSGTAPTSPAADDYWFDIPNSTWMKYSSGAFVTAGATLIGMSMQTSAACVAARTFDAFTAVSDINSIVIERVSNTVMQVRDMFAVISVNGNLINYGMRLPTWDITANLDSGIVEAANTYYYLYVKENGNTLVSDLAPTDLSGSRRGRYHPSEQWRCVGIVFNNASSHFDTVKFSSFGTGKELPAVAPGQPQGFGLDYSAAASAITVKLTDRIGNYPSTMLPAYVPFRNNTQTDGSYDLKPITRMYSATIPSGATLGHGTVADSYVFVSLHDNSTTLSLGVSSQLWDDSKVSNTTVLDVSADFSAIYTTAALTGNSFCRLGYLYYALGLNGVWAAPTRVTVGNKAGYEGITANELTSGGQVEWGGAGGEFIDVASIPLGVGEYTLSGGFNTINNGAITATFIECGISTVSGNSSTGLAQGKNLVCNMVTDGTSGFQNGIAVHGFEVSVTAPTTYYLKGYSSVVGGNFERIGYRLTAQRRREPKAPA